MVCIWEVDSTKLLYKVRFHFSLCSQFLIPVFFFQLPGHKGTVTSVDFHPKEPISRFLLVFLMIALLTLASLNRKQGWHNAPGRD